jgi:predicted polyphosphate/ATP-dependent NAD kinase
LREYGMKKRIGLIINPVSGMGGSVGLKGTEGEMFEKSLELGAHPVTPARTQDFLSHVHKKQEILLYTALGKMGEEYVKGFGVHLEVTGSIGEKTSAEDSKRIAREMLKKDIELLIFVGGDGTARDICDAVDSTVPVIAVPSGVKVFSSVFAVSARAAAELLDSSVENCLQAGQEASSTSSTSIENKRELAQYIVENMEHDVLYLLGPGTTVKYE